METAILKKGWGWWDVTSYPYGGSFQRQELDTNIILTGEHNQRTGIQFKLGERTGWAIPEAVARVEKN